MTLVYRLSGSLAALSFAGALIVMLTYFMVPDLRKHPTNMIFFLSLCDSLLSLKFMLTAVYSDSDELEHIATTCYMQAGWAQLWGIGSVAWNGMISLNLIINLQKVGFAKTASFGKYYHLFVWGLASLTTGIMYMGHGHIGPSGDGTCWIEKNEDPYRLLFFIPLIFFFSLSIASLVLCFTRTHNLVGLSDASRRGVMLRMVTYTGVFLLCWSGPVVHRIYLLSAGTDLEILQILDACGICVQGFANSMVWLTNPSFFTSFKVRILDKYFAFLLPSQEKSPLLHTLGDAMQDSKQDINRIDTLLRRNIITCLLLGIRSTLKEPAQSFEVTHRSYSESKVYNGTKLHSFEYEQASEGYEFIDYAPYVFSRMRAQSGISAQDYMEAMHPTSFIGSLSDQLQKFSEGRSNSFFIFSPDKRFIIKTLNKQEAELLLRILPNLHQYFLANLTTLLPRFYGCHGVRVLHGEVVYVIVMGNVFHGAETIHEQYDLKGSWVNRTASKNPSKKTKAGMDNDLDRKLKLASHRRQQLLDQLARDAMFLCSLNIMDYSVLLGFNFLKAPNPTTRDSLELQGLDVSNHAIAMDNRLPIENTENLSFHVSTAGDELYFLGIIDILQLYNTSKKAERFLKVFLLCRDKFGLSSMPPQDYARRFINAMNKIVE